MITKIVPNRYRFDFDNGHITKSPCKGCPRESELPQCAKDCPIISQLQTLLAGSILSSNNFSEKETYSLGRIL